jgi:hypothetical protein
MTEQHPITPSPSQLDRLEMMARATTDPSLLNEPAIRAGHFGVVHRKALRLAFAAGADQELEACCKWTESYAECGDSLRAARRPKPPSLKEQALAELEGLRGDAYSMGMGFDAPSIRRALEQLND